MNSCEPRASSCEQPELGWLEARSMKPEAMEYGDEM